jgi:hypothetical protein
VYGPIFLFFTPNFALDVCDARHDRYKARRMAGVKDRLFLGKMT